MPRPGESQTINGKTMLWEPSTKARDGFNYLGANSGYQTAEDAQAADESGNEGSWVEGTFKKPVSPWKIIGGMALAGGGGQALADYAVPALTGLFSGGAAGGAAATTAATATPASLTGGVMGGTTMAPWLGAVGSTVAPAAASTTGAGVGSGILGAMGGWGGLANAGINVGTGMLDAYAQGKQTDKTLAQQQKQFEASQAQNQRQFDTTQAQGQANQALSAAQTNPLAPAADRQSMALVNMLMQNYQPASYTGGKFTGGLNAITPEMMQSVAQYSSPSAMLAQENAFNSNAGAASGGKFASPPAGNVGYDGPDAKPNVMPTSDNSLQSLLAQLQQPQGNTSEDFVAQFAHLPWVGNDPSYWTGVIDQNGGLTDSNKAYWAQRMTDPPNVGSNAPNREQQASSVPGLQLSESTAQPSVMPGAAQDTTDPNANNLMALIARLTGKAA